MISKEDYNQVFEEAVTTTSEAFVKWARSADIKDLKQMFSKWITHFEKKNNCI